MMEKIRDVVKNHYSFSNRESSDHYVKALLGHKAFLSVDHRDVGLHSLYESMLILE